MKKSLKMLDDIIEIEKARDAEYIKFCHSVHKSARTIGQMGVLEMHLRNLKELIEQEAKEISIS